MKKLILFVSIIICALSVSAQVSNGFESLVADTTTNSETVYLAIDTPKAITYDYSVALYVIPVNESGTASVTAMPQWSPDNSIWFDLESSAVTVNNAGTVAKADFTYPNAYGRYYRIALVSTGTGVTSFSGALGLKRL